MAKKGSIMTLQTGTSFLLCSSERLTDPMQALDEAPRDLWRGRRPDIAVLYRAHEGRP
jgi:hypothetical protein